MEYNITQFVVKGQPDRIVLNAAQDIWVDIKNEMSSGDHDRYNKTLFQYEARQGMNRTDRRKLARSNKAKAEELAADEEMMKANFQPSTVLLLEINILAWNVPDETGTSMLLTRKNIARLTKTVTDILSDEVAERNPTQVISAMAEQDGESN